MLISRKNTILETPRIMFDHISEPSQVETKNLRIAACKSVPSLVFFALCPLSGASCLFWWTELPCCEVCYREAHMVRKNQQQARKRGSYLAQWHVRGIILVKTTWESLEVDPALSVKPWHDCSPGWHLDLVLWEILTYTTQLNYAWTPITPGSTEIKT